MREITCIICPLGCKARVTVEKGRITKVENVQCLRGEDYVRREIEAPTRDFFTTVRVNASRIPVLPVRSTKPIPKEKIQDCVLELAKTVVDAPVKAGDVIVEDPLGLGIKIIATRDLDRVKDR